MHKARRVCHNKYNNNLKTAPMKRFPAPAMQWLQRLLPTFLAINLLLLFFFLNFNYQLIFHSDAAVKNLLAQEIVETGQYFPPEWNYVNGDLWVFYTQTFILPLIKVMPNGFAAHLMSDLVSAALILWSAWLFTGLLDVSRAARLTGLIVLTAGMSVILAEHVFGQAAYGSMFYLGCFLVYCYWQQLHSQGRRRALFLLGVALVAIQVFWSNPQRAVVFFAAPLLAAAFALWLAERSAAADSGAPAGRALPHWSALGVFLLACALGLLLHVNTMRQVHNAPGLTELSWLTFDGMLHNLVATVQGVMTLFDGVPRKTSAVASAYGAYQLLRLLVALALLYLLPVALLRVFTPAHRSRLFAATFTGAALGLALLITLTTSVSDMSSPDASVRYLVPSLLCMLLILAAVAVDNLGLSLTQRVVALGAVAILAASGPFTYFFPYYLHFDVPPGRLLPTENKRLTDFLQQQGLKYGYASFWNAGKMTVIASHRVRVRQVNYEQGVPVPMRFLSSNRWYEPGYWNGETFLLLRQGEVAGVNLAYLARELGEPRVLAFEDFRIYVYGRNLATLPLWDRTSSQTIRFPLGSHSPHVIGNASPDALVAEPGMDGALHYGPFRTLEAGRYRVRVQLAASGPADEDHNVFHSV